MTFLVGFIVLVLVEIALLITLGSAIGLWLTLAWILLTAGLGIILLKGIAMMAGGGITYRLDEFRDLNDPVAHRALVLIAGLLLVLPGPLTDTVGILLLFAPLRRVALGLVARRFANPQTANTTTVVVDGEWKDVSAASRTRVGDSDTKKP